MKKFVKFIASFLAVLTVVVLASCGSGKYSAQEMADAVSFDYEEKTLTFMTELPKTVERAYENSDKVQTEEITWSSTDSRVKVNGYFVEFEYDEARASEYATIDANVKIGKETGTSQFKFRIAKESSFEEFAKATKGDALSISGYVACKGELIPASKKPEKNPGKASLILTDKTGTKFFYSHQTEILASVYENLEVGQFVGITGQKDIFEGVDQVKGSLVKLPGDKKVPTVTPVELTDANLDKEGFVENNTYAPATATLFVTGTPEDYKNQQRKAEVKALINDIKGTHEVYLCNHDYLFNFDREKPENNSQALKDIHTKLMGLKPGDTVKVEGYIAPYKGTTAFYVNEAAKLETVSSNPDYLKVASNAEKFIDEMNKVETNAAGEYVLTVNEGVTANITLSDTNQQVVTFDAATNKLVVNPTVKETKVTVNAEFSVNGIKLTRSFELTVKIPGSKFDEFINSANGDAIQNVTGVVTTARFVKGKQNADGTYKTSYAYVILQDANGAYYIRQAVKDEAEMLTYFKVGYNVTISDATVEIYYDLYRLSLKDLTVVTLGEQGTIPAAKELTEEMIKDPAQLKNLLSSTVTVTGVVTADGKAITVGSTNFNYFVDTKICGTKPANLVPGSKVTVTGVVAIFKGTYQINPLTADSVVVVTPAPTPAA